MEKEKGLSLEVSLVEISRETRLAGWRHQSKRERDGISWVRHKQNDGDSSIEVRYGLEMTWDDLRWLEPLLKTSENPDRFRGPLFCVVRMCRTRRTLLTSCITLHHHLRIWTVRDIGLCDDLRGGSSPPSLQGFFQSKAQLEEVYVDKMSLVETSEISHDRNKSQ